MLTVYEYVVVVDGHLTNPTAHAVYPAGALTHPDGSLAPGVLHEPYVVVVDDVQPLQFCPAPVGSGLYVGQVADPVIVDPLHGYVVLPVLDLTK